MPGLGVLFRMAFPSDEELVQAGWVRISRRERRIQSSTRARQYYWVDFPHDAYAPEFVGEHPGVVIRGGQSLHATSIVVPVTSQPQKDERYVHKLLQNPNPVGHRDGIGAYVICNHLYTVNICRLRPILDPKGRPIYPRVEQADFEGICELIRKALFPPGPKAPEEVRLVEKAAEDPNRVGKGGRPILGLKRQV